LHELPVIQSVLDLCIKHANAHDARKVISVTLRVGAASDLQEEWVQRYFDYLSKGTMAQGATLIIERVPVVLRCKHCTREFPANLRDAQKISCPQCHATEFEYVSGREYRVERMEVV
jgi:hydrogenase nickel incorporation protein HypA/HybF